MARYYNPEDTMRLGLPTPDSLQEQTIAFWIKALVSGAGSETFLYCLGANVTPGPGANGFWTTYTAVDGFPKLYQFGGGSQRLILTGTKTIYDGRWHHVAFVTAGASLASAQIFIDGVGDATGTTTGPTNFGGAVATVFGGSVGVFNYNAFSGTMCELCTWYSAKLNASEIAQLYNGRLPWLIRPDNLFHYIPSYGVSFPVANTEANFGTSRSSVVITGTRYDPHAPITQLDLGFPGSIGAQDLPETWTGTFALANFANSPPSGFGDWSPPSV